MDNADAQMRGDRDRPEADAAFPEVESRTPAILSFAIDRANMVPAVALEDLGV